MSLHRLVPQSLLGQVLLAVAAALLAAQGVAAALLWHAGEQRREAELVHAAAFQLLDHTPSTPRLHRRLRGGGGHRAFLPRPLRVSDSAADPLLPGERRNPAREAALAAIFARQGELLADIRVTERAMQRDPLVQRFHAENPERAARMRRGGAPLGVFAIRRSANEPWRVARVPVPRGDGALLPTLALQTLLLFAALFGLLYLLLRRITRPLAALAERTARFDGSSPLGPPLAPSGPADVRHLIEAHGAMESRVYALLDEKDVMLGAIGHDLKTPLAALRVRIEAVEDETARTRMAATIREITTSLDDILALARVGRPHAPAERTDLGALAAGVVEAFEDLGEPVTLSAGARVVAPVHGAWLSRGLSNLVTNALRYAGAAEVAVLQEGGMAVLRVSDRGPGIPQGRIADMTQPFTRGEASRNRETGGAGLGLALTRAVAEQHGGRLVLANRQGGGLSAEIRLPLA